MVTRTKKTKASVKKTKRKSASKPKSKKILMVSSEAVPFSKTGGLADVCGALPKALKVRGHEVCVVIPRFWSIDSQVHNLKKVISPLGVPMGSGTVWCEVLKGEVDGVTYYFIEHEGYFGRAGFYDDGHQEYDDNASRFGFFSRACLQLCVDLKFKPDVIHCNDWQTALVPAYLKIAEFHNDFFKNTASIFSIHNMAYQGVFSPHFLPFLNLGFENFTESKFESNQAINFMKGAIFYADAVSTVSPTYAKEILSDPGSCGLGTFLQRRKDDLVGILNGVDYEHWDPSCDTLIPKKYSVKSMSGKKICKRALQKEFQLEENENIPIIGIVSRFASQKGFELLVPVIKSIVSNMVVQFVFLGSGEKSLEDFFGGLPREFPGRIGAWIGYNNQKSHLIEAGSDFFLMPSLYEPCGLNQIYSMKYGTLPIVRATGGLRDTVDQYDEKTGAGTGFLFESIDASAIYYTIGWAISTFFDRPHHFRQMQQRGMKQHFSWEESATSYEQLYERAIVRRKTWS